MQNKNNCEVVIAGPGAGKTYNMVQKILAESQNFQPNRFCAVITYTNAATDEIRTRLEKHIKIPNNIFIGTTHSFLIRFFITPFSHLLGITPHDLIYIDSAKLNYKPSNKFAKKSGEIKIAEDLTSKGIVTYDKVLEKSYHIISKERQIAKIISNRLQYVFIDEYQDTRLYQHLIVKKLFAQGYTRISCIGDPLQSIFKFTYFMSQLKDEPQPTTFEETPLLNLRDENEHSTSYIRENYRSSPTIINFVNNFNKIFQQIPSPKNPDLNIPIYFINETSKQRIVDTFFELKKKHNIEEENNIRINNLFLSRKWSLFEEIAENNNINRLSKNNRAKTQLQEISKCVLGLIGMKKSEVLKITDEISYRKFCFKVIRTLRSKKFSDDRHRENTVRKMFETDFNCTLDKSNRGKLMLNDSIEQVTTIRSFTDSAKYYSTIHSAKGLEATSVLVCAETSNQLEKWLEDNGEKLRTLDDDYRLGYVAFSRARKFLCIACLSTISKDLESKIREFKINCSDEMLRL